MSLMHLMGCFRALSRTLLAATSPAEDIFVMAFRVFTSASILHSCHIETRIPFMSLAS